MIRQVQVVIPPGSATFKDLYRKTNFGDMAISSHFGEVRCPFCEKTNILAGPAKGAGSAWAHDPCEHNEGAVAGSGYDSTFIFRGGA